MAEPPPSSSSSSSSSSSAPPPPAPKPPAPKPPAPKPPAPKAAPKAAARGAGLRHRKFVIGGLSFEVDSRYHLKSVVGKGAYGLVCAAEDLQATAAPSGAPPEATAHSMVAVKKILDPFHDRTDSKRLLREIRLLRTLQHPNVLHLVDMSPPPSLSPEGWKDVYLVTRLFDTNLHRVIYSGQPLTDAHVQYILWQLFRALRYMHAAGVVHRDLKPTNVLLNRDCELALADFGLARHITQGTTRRATSDVSATDRRGQLTKYVVTRWYRAPELLVQNHRYDSAVDMWSVGCILAELLGAKALFPGKDSLHQLRLIVERLGTPQKDELAQIENAQAVQYIHGLSKAAATAGGGGAGGGGGGGGSALRDLFPDAPADCVDLLGQLLQFSPSKRPTASQALAHPYLRAYHEAPEEDLPIPDVDMAFEAHNPSRDALRQMVWQEVCHYHPELRKEPGADGDVQA